MLSHYCGSILIFNPSDHTEGFAYTEAAALFLSVTNLTNSS